MAMQSNVLKEKEKRVQVIVYTKQKIGVRD